jgi:hypothetical protein
MEARVGDVQVHEQYLQPPVPDRVPHRRRSLHLPMPFLSHVSPSHSAHTRFSASSPCPATRASCMYGCRPRSRCSSTTAGQRRAAASVTSPSSSTRPHGPRPCPKSRTASSTRFGGGVITLPAVLKMYDHEFFPREVRRRFPSAARLADRHTAVVPDVTRGAHQGQSLVHTGGRRARRRVLARLRTRQRAGRARVAPGPRR